MAVCSRCGVNPVLPAGYMAVDAWCLACRSPNVIDVSRCGVFLEVWHNGACVFRVPRKWYDALGRCQVYVSETLGVAAVLSKSLRKELSLEELAV